MTKEVFSAIAARTGFVMGVTLHLNWWPQTAPDRSLVVAFNGGRTVAELPDRQDLFVQVLSRAKDPNDAYVDTMTAFTALHGKAGIAMPVLVSGQAWEAMMIEALTAPQYLGEDERGRHLWTTNYLWQMKDASK